MLIMQAWGPEIHPQNPIKSVVWWWAPLISVLRNQRQVIPWGSMANEPSIISKSCVPVGEPIWKHKVNGEPEEERAYTRTHTHSNRKVTQTMSYAHNTLNCIIHCWPKPIQTWKSKRKIKIATFDASHTGEGWETNIQNLNKKKAPRPHPAIKASFLLWRGWGLWD